ncbi:MAG: dTMP kinase [Coriobacteriia bacterium]|nr:dTMP kinase [Coriobacteriia bacterium]
MSTVNESAAMDTQPANTLPGAMDEVLSTGVFVTFEGGEGVGKSTHIKILAERLIAAGFGVVQLREPGGTTLSEKIRTLLLDPDSDVAAQAELLLYEAARAQLVTERILPALASGAVVLCDRYLDSTTAYQGYGRRIDLALIAQANQLGSLGVLPTRTILMVDNWQEALARARALGTDRLEAEDFDFHQRVNLGFEQIAADHKDRVRIVRLQKSIEATAELIYAELADLFEAT